MTHLTIFRPNHRPETPPLCQPLMEEYRRLKREEPPHPLSPRVIRGQVTTENYGHDQDIEYPAFGQQQCRMPPAVWKIRDLSVEAADGLVREHIPAPRRNPYPEAMSQEKQSMIKVFIIDGKPYTANAAERDQQRFTQEPR